MSEYVSTEAVILRARDYKETDQLLTVYTRDHGKMTILVKGVKKNTSKLRGGVQLFSRADLTLVLGKAFPVVINASCVDAFVEIRQDLKRMSYASYCTELVDKLLVGEEPDQAVFVLILQVMNLLAYLNPWVAAKVLEIRLLDLLGYGVDFHHCASCGAMLNRRAQVGGAQDGLLCTTCWSRAEILACHLSVEAVTVLDGLRQLPMAQMNRLWVSAEARRELDDYLDLVLTGYLEQELKTRSFLRQMGIALA